MNNTFKNNPRRAKKCYAKPLVKQIELKVEEAILGACKTTGHSGPSCANCHAVINCSVQGS